jgi:hypothetical protein
MVEQIHQVTGGNFRGVDMIIPRILEIERRNRQKFADGAVKMNEVIKVAAALDDLRSDFGKRREAFW